MNEALDRLAREVGLDTPSGERLRLEFGHACVCRVEQFIEQPAVLECLRGLGAYLRGSMSRTELASLSMEAARLANQHQGSRSLDGSGHAAVSATYAVANAVAGKARQAAAYAAYAAVYGQGGYGAVIDRQSFEPEFAWQVSCLSRLVGERSAPATFALVPCDQSGAPVRAIADVPQELVANCLATADLYRRVGFEPPWIGYVAVIDNRGVGGGAFVGPPKEGCVEIAYFTLENERGRRIASQTAAALVQIARARDPSVGLKAFTLEQDNPSTRILEGLGFSKVGIAHDADAGEVWEWRA